MRVSPMTEGRTDAVIAEAAETLEVLSEIVPNGDKPSEWWDELFALALPQRESAIRRIEAHALARTVSVIRDLLAALASEKAGGDRVGAALADLLVTSRKLETAQCGSKMLLAAIMVAADDAEPNDFELSFPEVRAVYDLQLMRKGAEAELARLRAECEALEKQVAVLQAAKDAADAQIAELRKENYRIADEMRLAAWDLNSPLIRQWADLLAPPKDHP